VNNAAFSSRLASSHAPQRRVRQDENFDTCHVHDERDRSSVVVLSGDKLPLQLAFELWILRFELRRDCCARSTVCDGAQPAFCEDIARDEAHFPVAFRIAVEASCQGAFRRKVDGGVRIAQEPIGLFDQGWAVFLVTFQRGGFSYSQFEGLLLDQRMLDLFNATSSC
jgi:hypothetical protein